MPHGTHALVVLTNTKAVGFILRKKPLHSNTVATAARSTVITSDLASSAGVVRPWLLWPDTAASIPVESTIVINLKDGQT
jgi:hypothetical protein